MSERKWDANQRNGYITRYPNSPLMKKNREIVLARHSICQNCEIAEATEIHHIDEIKDNHSLDNLMAVCRSCNQKFVKKRSSKYKKLYGKTLKEMTKAYGLPMATVRYLVVNQGG